jgi:aspartate aminotransferase/aminotransferase
MTRDHLSKRARAFQTSGIRKIFDLASNLKDPYNFSIGQPDFGPTEAVNEKTIEAIRAGKSGYTVTQGIPELRAKIAEKLKRENDIHPDTTEEILVTPGVSAGMFLALAAVIDPGDEVIIPDPYFAEYPTLVEFLGGIPVYLDTYPDFELDARKLEGLVNSKTKAIIINSPNNPTGAVYPENTLRDVAYAAGKNDVLVISDEIYEKFVYGVPHFSIGSTYKNTVTLQGLSKSGGMPGWRLAWATGPRVIIDKMKEMQQYTFVCAPTLVQYGALAAFDDTLANHVAEYEKRRDLIIGTLSKKFNVVVPHGAFYVMAEVGDGDRFAEWALARNVLLVPGSAFSRKNSHARLSYATSPKQIEKGANLLLAYA